MSPLAVTTIENPRSGDGEVPARPLWLEEFAAECVVRKVVEYRSNIFLTTLESAHDRLVQARVRGAESLGRDQFEETTICAYGAIAEELAEAPARHPVRFWNLIPRIHRACEGGVDRYMNFNAGRYEAFRRWFGADNLDRLPTASGIGHDGDDLIIEVLATDVEGFAVDNPRQIPPVRYSRRYGPRPPCFARATLVRGRTPRLLVGGTASVVGEISMHDRDLTRQIEETLANLRSLLGSSGLDLPWKFSDLRVYHPRPDDAGAIAQAVRRGFPGSTRIELTRADLCRRELLVEIEGVAKPQE
jgi:chorismate lyase / 3-hydroxybenzoate synthase